MQVKRNKKAIREIVIDEKRNDYLVRDAVAIGGSIYTIYRHIESGRLRATKPYEGVNLYHISGKNLIRYRDSICIEKAVKRNNKINK